MSWSWTSTGQSLLLDTTETARSNWESGGLARRLWGGWRCGKVPSATIVLRSDAHLSPSLKVASCSCLLLSAGAISREFLLVSEGMALCSTSNPSTQKLSLLRCLAEDNVRDSGDPVSKAAAPSQSAQLLSPGLDLEGRWYELASTRLCVCGRIDFVVVWPGAHHGESCIDFRFLADTKDHDG